MLRHRLERAPAFVLVVFAMTAAFATYFCMYAFRKPFAAAEFRGLSFFGTHVTLKTAFVISQVVGYTVSKYLGVKFCSEMTRGRRAMALVILILAAEVSLVLFAVLPGSSKAFAMLLNGLPLGMIWGLVVWYLEGRRSSEILLAGLSCSFIVSSGMVKDVGRWLLTQQQVDQWWMPAATGAMFLPLFLVSVWMLNQVPEPTRADIEARVQRQPMTSADRWAFVRRFAPGLFMLLVTYFLLTAYRDYRDNYGIEVLKQLGYGDRTAIFTRTELPIAFAVMIVLALLNLVRDNRKGLLTALGIMGLGAVVMGGATVLMDAGQISGFTWMILIGLGAYLAYVPYGSVLFDRLMASTGFVGTAVFAIYLADALGYTGSVAIQLYKDLWAGEQSRLAFLHAMTYAMSGLGIVMFSGAAVYFGTISRRRREATGELVAIEGSAAA
jgi:hypothetical protein